MNAPYNTQPYILPNQKMTESEKIRDYGSLEGWAKATIESLIGLNSQFRTMNVDATYRKQINYNLVAGYVNEDDFKYVTKPFGMTGYNFPATFVNYNIIVPKVGLLEGEESARPFNFHVMSVGDEDTNEILREKTAMMKQVFQQHFMSELASMGVNVNNPQEVEQQTPQQITDYFAYTYKSAKELSAQNALDYLYKNIELQNKFNLGWRDLLISGEEVYWTGIVSGEPVVELVNPVYFHYDKNPDLLYIEDSAWAYRELYVPPSEIYDKYYDVLTDEDVTKIEQMKGGHSGTTVMNTSIGVPITYTAKDDGLGARAVDRTSSVFVRVVHCEWKSLTKIGFVSWVDENGQPQETIVDETYKPSKLNNEEVDWRWINTVWEATRIGDDIYANVRPKPNQYRDLNNPSKCKLGYIGVMYHARNSQSQSLVELMKPHQYLYNIVMYRLELELARAQGKKVVIDLAQIPRSEGFDIDRWLYYFNVLGISFINSFEEGKGKFAGQRPSFNQFQQFDMSLARVIDQYVALLDKIEGMVGEISGVTRQREGQINSSETVGGVERSVRQSSYITESLFMHHNMCKQHVLTALLETTQLAWADGKRLNFVAGDLTRTLMEISGPDFSNAAYGIFVTDSSREDSILKSIQQLAQYAMSSQQATLKDIVAVMEANNVTKAKKILESAEQRAQKQVQQQQQHEQDMQNQQIQAQMQQHQGDLQFQDEINKRDNDTKIQVALVAAEAQEKVAETKQGPSPEELAIKAKDVENNYKVKTRDLQLKEQHNRRTAEIDKTNKEKLAGLKEKVDTTRLEHEKKMDKTENKQSTSLEERKFKADRSLEQKKANDKAALEANKVNSQKALDLQKLQHEKEQADKELAQKEEEHKREQLTKIAQERIKGDAAVEVAKNTPTPKAPKK